MGNVESLTVKGAVELDSGADNRNLFENESDFGVTITPPTNFDFTTLV